MTTQHTPLSTASPEFDDKILNCNGEIVAEVVYGSYIERAHFALRIVACVNAADHCAAV